MADRGSGDNEATQKGAIEPKRRGWRRAGFPLLAVAVALVPFVIVEAALRIFDAGDREAWVDPLVGFSELTPLFEVDEADGVYRTALSRQLSFEPQEFLAQKPKDGFRVFCLGGSTVRGRPYTTASAFSTWLRLELEGSDPSRTYEVMNCGGLSYASYRLTRILDEVLEYDPDLIVIATGHNEFLEDRTYESIKTRSAGRAWVEDRVYSLRTVQAAARLWKKSGDNNNKEADDTGKSILPDKVTPKLDDASGYASYHRDDEWRAGVVAHFEQSVRAMIDMCRRAEVPVVLVGLGSNLRDCPPFKSEHKPGLSPEQERTWQAAFDEAAQIAASNPERALELYRQAEAIDDEYALLPYRMARLLDRLGRTEEAGEFYMRAKECDVCPLRMLEDEFAILRTIAGESGVPFVDSRTRLERQSADGIPGYRWYMDHVHPTIGAHQQIAQEIAVEMKELNLLGDAPLWNDEQRRTGYRRHFAQLGPVHFVNGRERLNWLENWAQRQRLYEETLPDGPRSHLAHGFRRLDLGETEQAWLHFRAALEADEANAESPAGPSGSTAARTLLDHALQLFHEGRPEAAHDLLGRLRQEAAAEPLAARFDLALLVLALETGNDAAAVDICERRQSEFAQFTADNNDWLAAMPDALARCRRIRR